MCRFAIFFFLVLDGFGEVVERNKWSRFNKKIKKKESGKGLSYYLHHTKIK